MSEKLPYPELPANHAKNIYGNKKPVSETIFGQVAARLSYIHANNKIGNPTLRRQIMNETSWANQDNTNGINHLK